MMQKVFYGIGVLAVLFLLLFVQVKAYVAEADSVPEEKSKYTLSYSADEAFCEIMREYIAANPSALADEAPSANGIIWIEWSPVARETVRESTLFSLRTKEKVLNESPLGEAFVNEPFDVSRAQLVLGEDTHLDIYRFTPHMLAATEFCRFVPTENNKRWLDEKRLAREDGEEAVYSEPCRYFTYQEGLYTVDPGDPGLYDATIHRIRLEPSMKEEPVQRTLVCAIHHNP